MAKKKTEPATQDDTKPVGAETPKEKTKKDIQKEMEANAKIIQDAKAKPVVEVAPAIVIVPSDTPIQEILGEWITYGDGQTSLQVAEGMPVEEWTAALAFHCHMQEHVGFLIGDLIAYGSSHYGEKYSAAVAAVGREYKTLTNWVNTAKSVPAENRRKELGYSHHAEVASLTHAKQKRLLAKAVAEKWTVSTLRTEVKKLEEKKTETTAAEPAGTASSGSTMPDSSIIHETSGEVPGLEMDGGSEAPSEPKQVKGTVVSDASEEDKLKNSGAIEHADALQTYFRSETFSKLGVVDLKQWLGILKPLAERYETLLDTVG